MSKLLRYTIKAIVEVPIDDPQDITEVLDKITEYGEYKIESVEVIEEKK